MARVEANLIHRPASNISDKVIVKEIPIPSEKAMVVKLLMSPNEKYELKGSTIAVGLNEVRARSRTIGLNAATSTRNIYSCSTKTSGDAHPAQESGNLGSTPAYMFEFGLEKSFHFLTEASAETI